MNHWIIFGTAAVLIGGYIGLFIWGRRKQREFEEKYESAKQRYEVFVLIKRTVRKKPESGLLRFFKIKTYQVVGRVNLSQAMKGMRISRMQTVTFQTLKSEYRKVEPHHSYKMDVAGDYIGHVVAPSPSKKRASPTGLAAWGKKVKSSLFGRKENAGDRKSKQGKRGKQKKNDGGKRFAPIAAEPLCIPGLACPESVSHRLLRSLCSA